MIFCIILYFNTLHYVLLLSKNIINKQNTEQHFYL